MLDVRYVRENPEAVRMAMQSRNSSWDVDAFLELDAQRRSLVAEVEVFQARRNEVSKSVGAMMKDGRVDDAEAAKQEVRDINQNIEDLDKKLTAVQTTIDDMVFSAPNIPAEDVPVGADEDANVEVRRWGTPRQFDFEPKPHWDLGTDLNIIDFERGVKLAKSRCILLPGDGAKLQRALINFMLDTHEGRGYQEFALPVLTNAASLKGTGQLPKFEDDLFKTTDGLYLIPTAEVALTNIHREEVLEADTLPRKYTAFTECFRKEAGSAGRDTRGVIRLHQFEKVEMVKLARPEESDAELEGMVGDAENILQLLGLPYRIITLCTGDMGFGARKTYDLEVWLPSYDNYKEISSCSNCGDFQARRASIKYRDPSNFKGSRFVHTLNGSGLAINRTFAAILENYQQEDGTISIPEVLQPYMKGRSIVN